MEGWNGKLYAAAASSLPHYQFKFGNDSTKNYYFGHIFMKVSMHFSVCPNGVQHVQKTGHQHDKSVTPECFNMQSSETLQKGKNCRNHFLDLQSAGLKYTVNYK